MAMEPCLCDGMTGLMMLGAQRLADNSGVIMQNLTQGLGVVQTSFIQMNASNSDDPALIAALNTASRAPIPTTSTGT